MNVAQDMSANQPRLLETLEKLLEMTAAEQRIALVQACDLVATALNADKVDAFLYDDARDSLVALGTSTQPLSAQQRRHGLDVLPLANRGRAVQTFVSRSTFVSGAVQEDMEELRGIREVLRVASQVATPLVVGGVVRGVLLVCSLAPGFFTADDVRFLETVGHWVGVVAHRAELVEQIGRDAAERARRRAAEELITVLAHDLRNLISPIDGRIQLVRMRHEREGRTADLRDIDLAHRGLGRLTSLIADILDTARIEKASLELELSPTELRKLVTEVSATFSTPTQPIMVHAAEDVAAMIDANRIRRCMENLVANAVKHSPRGAPVHVTLSRYDREDGEWVRIEVLDEGPGVPADIAPHIFDRFFTAQKRTGGLGLGLFVSRAIASMHGGDLVVEPSEPGKGARFTLTFPCARDRNSPT